MVKPLGVRQSASLMKHCFQVMREKRVHGYLERVLRPLPEGTLPEVVVRWGWLSLA